MNETTDHPVSFTRAGETPTGEMPLLIPRPQRTIAAEPVWPTFDLSRAPKIVVGDVPFTVTSFSDAVQWLLAPTNREGARSVRLANAYCVAQARQNPAYADVLRSPGINLPDGTPVHWMMQRTTRRSTLAPERVRGPSLFAESLAADSDQPVRHYFLGGTPGTLAGLRDRITREFPDLDVAGMYSPPFGPVTPELVNDWADRISASGATIVWLGLGSPKQDIASTLLAPRVGLHCIGVGAAFDFLAGTQSEAPQWTQRLALEWAYRLATEPRRLWRRYLLGNLQFLRAALTRPGRSREVIQAVTHEGPRSG
jgi:N-acetylglucosaminyldiphosphoundecaprenol N-acetyl-beta-D-mannosaminyltransferase